MLLKNIITSILAFVATNVDDLFILMLFYGNRKIKTAKILAGQSIGIAALVGLSLVGAYVADFIDQRYVGLLGLFPIYLGTREIIGQLKHKSGVEEKGPALVNNVLAIAGVTIANGGDNLGVYIPLLTTMKTAEKIQMVMVFGILVYVWCMAAKKLATYPLVARQLDRYGHIITPAILFLLGLLILYESDTHRLLT